MEVALTSSMLMRCPLCVSIIFARELSILITKVSDMSRISSVVGAI